MHKDSSTKQYLEISVYVYIWILEYNGRIWLQLGYRGNSETDYWEMDIRSDTRLFTLPFQNNFIQSHWKEFSNSGYFSGIQRSNRYYLADLQGRRAGRGVWDRVSDSWSFSYFKRLLCCDLWHFLGSIKVDSLLDTLKVLDELQHVLLHPFMRQDIERKQRDKGCVEICSRQCFRFKNPRFVTQSRPVPARVERGVRLVVTDRAPWIFRDQTCRRCRQISRGLQGKV